MFVQGQNVARQRSENSEEASDDELSGDTVQVKYKKIILIILVF
jgi:hypothetical protein